MNKMSWIALTERCEDETGKRSEETTDGKRERESAQGKEREKGWVRDLSYQIQIRPISFIGRIKLAAIWSPMSLDKFERLEGEQLLETKCQSYVNCT